MDSLPDLRPVLSTDALLGLSVTALATFAALDMTHRVQGLRAAAGWRWRLIAAVSLGTGVVSAHVTAMSTLPLPSSLPFELGYDSAAIFFVWLAAVTTGLLALGWAGRRAATPGRVLTGAAMLGAGILGAQVAAIQSMGFQPGIEWHRFLPALALAFAPTLLMSLMAMWAFFRPFGGDPALPRARRSVLQVGGQGVAALALGFAIWTSQCLVIGAAQLDQQTASVFETRLPEPGLLGPAALAVIALLLMMLVSAKRDSGMRASLETVQGELEKRSQFDPLTELPNRHSFEIALVEAARRADARGARMAVLAINLDGFKAINESFGHDNGDRMLREIATRLRVMVRAEDAVARLGADEFLVLVDGNPTSDDVASLAATLLDVVCRPCTLDHREATASCAIGIAMYPEHGATTALIAHAETALRSAKRTGGETFCFFETRMLNGAREHVDLLRDLRRALAHQEFELVYQPKVAADTGLLSGVEALIRWRHPQRGIISPGVFIPIAERFGLIGAIGDWVIDEACRQAHAWLADGLRVRVSVNLSLHQLRRADLPEYIVSALGRNHVEPDMLICEITESAAMEDPEGTMAMFRRLSNIGVYLSIDDFGTGYSSLAYLRKLPASELKIDRSFVLDLESSGDACSVVSAVIKLAQALGLKVVAEGVETAGQRDILKELGCDELQGFLFAKPMSAKALSVWAIEDWRPAPFLKAVVNRPSPVQLVASTSTSTLISTLKSASSPQGVANAGSPARPRAASHAAPRGRRTS